MAFVVVAVDEVPCSVPEDCRVAGLEKYSRDSPEKLRHLLMDQTPSASDPSITQLYDGTVTTAFQTLASSEYVLAIYIGSTPHTTTDQMLETTSPSIVSTSGYPNNAYWVEYEGTDNNLDSYSPYNGNWDSETPAISQNPGPGFMP
jgi:hypothetical protein